MSASPRPMSRKKKTAAPSRLLPFSVAGGVCLITAIILGYGGWYLFGSRHGSTQGGATEVKQTPPAPSPQGSPTAQPSPPPTSAIVLAPAGELPVPGGEVVIGGGDTNLPLRREMVSPFAIAETEVTNEQYREFVVERKYKAPAGWQNDEFPPGSALEPVTGITWQQAVDYCRWLSEKINATVRLPTEAEWELAARGRENYKYPWGNEWDPRAAASEETNGHVRAVKSYPEGKSPFGAYDMAGNVWEWIADEARDADGRPKSKNGVSIRITKGGAATEPAAAVTAISREEVRADFSDPALGFRYVVVRSEKTAVSAGTEQ